MKKRVLLTILALLTMTPLAMGCPILVDAELPEGPYPAPPKEWSRTFGGPERDCAYSVQQTADAGFIITGSTTRRCPSLRQFQLYRYFWLVKTDPEGNKQWSQTFGGSESEGAYSVQQTADGGFIIAGETYSFGKGRSDFWLVKTDPQGNKEWSQTFGGPEEDRAYSVQQTACGGFILAGTTESFGAGKNDFWLVKTDPQGNKEWSRTFGGSWSEEARSVQQTACGGFVITGTTWSFGAGKDDFWLIKTDPQGNKEWSHTFGGPQRDTAYSVQQTACGGFIVAGQTAKAHARAPSLRLMGGVPPTPITCIWVVKTDAHGNIQWTQTFGTLRENDVARSVQQTACSGFIIAGSTRSFGAGKDDVWLIKLAPEQ
ncbi:hypothetical protein M1O14_00925 [Dehalococcoidia bacterium]|nr:hypothetical protein [Dehalococcoidia bacterium]